MGLKALVLLAFHFWKHVLRKVTFRYSAGGPERFISNYLPDRLLPIEGSTRDDLASWQRCIACGLCDAAYAAEGGTQPVMSTVLAGVRDFSRMPDAARDAAAIDNEAGLRAATEACPMDVPVADVVRYVAAAPARLQAVAPRA